jgi:hypothetical protein
MKIKIISTIFVFALAFILRISLIDTEYHYSFEPDSEPCVVVTRSFYFFYHSPFLHNAPQTLDTYPNYSDGDFIASALFANLIRPLCQHNVITAPLGDGDNSLIIFSMRWSAAIMDAASAAIAYLILLLLVNDTLIALSVILLCYLLNQQTFDIDLMRVDHFVLFTGNFAMLAGILLFLNTDKAEYYVLAGLAAGLVSGTKINFPFYLLVIVLVFLWIVNKKKANRSALGLAATSFLLTFIFMYQRWLMYPGNIGNVLKFTLHNGTVWTSYWGTNNHSYYLCDIFFEHGYSYAVTLVLAIAYVCLIILAILAIIKRDSLKGILVLTFILQAIALMFSPKVERYGIILPLWISVFLAFGFRWALTLFTSPRVRLGIRLAFIIALIPNFIHALGDYNNLKAQCDVRGGSIIENRIKPCKWIRDNIQPGSVIAYQFTRVSNPPVFEMPYFFEYKRLTCPFLFKDKLLSFYPPNLDSLKLNTNYVIINSKETDFHFYMMESYYHDTVLAKQWRHFYARLRSDFLYHDFSSPNANYGLKSVSIYRLNPLPLKCEPTISFCTSEWHNGVALVKWKLNNFNIDSDYSYEIQIAGDSSFQWLISGSYDGFPSCYRSQNQPFPDNNNGFSVVPIKIKQIFLQGGFRDLLHGANPNDKRVMAGMENFYRNVLLTMIDRGVNFKTALSMQLKGNQEVIKRIESIMAENGGIDFRESNLSDYLKLSGLSITPDQLAELKSRSCNFSFQPTVSLCKGKAYYWRVRLRYKYNVLSDWSPVSIIRPA